MITTATPASGLDHLGAWSSDQVQQLADRANALRAGAAPQRFDGKALGLFFLNPSLRTSASFQRAAARLGLELVQLRGDGVWGLEHRDGVVMDGTTAEHLREAAPVLGRYVDLLAVRAFPGAGGFEETREDPVMQGFHRWAGVPVINMESARWHPCQALADWATLDQHAVPKPAKFVLSWAWHPKPLPHAVPNSTLCMAAQRGMEVVLLCPPGLELHPAVMAEAEALAQANQGSVRVSHDRGEALQGASAVYAKSWGSQQHWGDLDAETAFRAGLRDWCVTPDWLGADTHFMHCLPIRRNVVASDAVLDGPQSIVLDQAEHRLHAQTALLEDLLS